MRPLVAIALLALLLTGLERLFRRAPPPRVPGSRRLDALYWLLGRASDLLSHGVVVLWAGALAVVTGLGARNVEPWLAAHTAAFSSLPRAAQIALAIVLVDLVAYWTHRAIFHASPLWRFHAIHHSAERLDWLAAARNHPLAPAIAALAHGLPLVALGIDPRVLVAVAPIFGVWAVFIHANVPFRFGPLRYVVATPLFHRWHHARDVHGVNFAGLLPIWDILFGTFYCPAHEPEAFGTRDPVPTTLLGQLAHPFRDGERTGERARVAGDPARS